MPSTQKRKEEKIDKLGPYKQITFNLTYLPRKKKKKKKEEEEVRSPYDMLRQGARSACVG